MHPLSQSDLFVKTYELASFIVPDMASAQQIAEKAFSEVEITVAGQQKRRYYKANDHYKVTWARLQLLQRLVFEHSERYERELAQSSPASVSEAMWWVWFIKHLARTSLKRNPFYVTLGLGRLLYTYTTAEVIKIYELLTNQQKEGMQYRRGKSVLLTEVLERFGPIIQLQNSNPGEELRLELHPTPAPYLIELALQSLIKFTPWGSKSLSDDQFAQLQAGDLLKDVLGLHRDPNPELTYNLTLLHTMFNPEALRKLTQILNLDDPHSRIGVPKFMLTTGSNHPSTGNQGGVPPLTQDQIKDSFKRIDRENKQRSMVAITRLSIWADSQEQATIDLSRGADRAYLKVSEATESISVWAVEDQKKVLLAKYYLSFDDEEIPEAMQECSIEIPNNQSVVFQVKLIKLNDETFQYGVKVIFRRASVFSRAFALGKSLLTARGGVQKMIMVGLMTCALSLSAWLVYNRSSVGPDVPNHVKQPPVLSPPVSNPPISKGVPIFDPNRVGLRKSVVIQFGAGQFEDQLKVALTKELAASLKVNVVTESGADLKLTLTRTSFGDGENILLELKTPDGKVVWSEKRVIFNQPDEASAQELARQFAKSLEKNFQP